MMTTEQKLRLIADAEHFAPGEDRLTEMIREADDEMDESALELVSAAGAKPSFTELLRRKGEQNDS